MQRALIVASQPLISLSLSLLIKKEGYKIVDEHSDGLKALQYIKNNTTDLLITEIDLPSLDGLELIKQLRKSDFSLKIIVIGNYKQSVVINYSMAIGANGYIFTNDKLDNMSRAIHAVMSGYCYFPMQDHKKIKNDCPEPYSHLSSRELQVLRQLVSGKKGITIAEDMKISYKTVSTYKHRILKKLSLNSVVDLMDYVKMYHL